MRYAFFTFRNVDDSQCVEWCRVCSSVKGGRVTHCLRAKIDCQGAYWCRLLSLIAWLQQCQGVPSPSVLVLVCSKRSPATVMSEFDIFISSTGNFNILAPETSVSNTSSTNMRFTSACTRDGFFFSVGVCHCVLWSGTGIGNKRLMGVMVRVPLPKAKLRLPALNAEIIVFTQEQRFPQVSRFKAVSRVSPPGLETRTTSVSMWKWRNCTFLPSMQRSLSLLRNTVQVEFLYVCCDFGVPLNLRPYEYFRCVEMIPSLETSEALTTRSTLLAQRAWKA